ncbi:MAG: hypothetical protein L6V86_08165 [Treponema sp.]|nr:MAG: hypothetical protein L6V86_08165 [Treponema sp.]
MPGIGASISESEVDSLIRNLKTFGLKQNAYDIHRVAIDFANENGLSDKDKTEVIELSNEILKVSKIKKVLAKNWIVTQRNMGVIGFTMFFAVFSVIGINVLAFGLALALDTGIRGQKILRTIFFLPNVLSMIIVALIWSMLFVQLLPAITGIEMDFGFKQDSVASGYCCCMAGLRLLHDCIPCGASEYSYGSY